MVRAGLKKQVVISHLFFANIINNKMRLSKYIVQKKINNEYILFSTISKNIIRVNKNFYNELKNIDENNLKFIKTSELKYLIENYFIIKDGVNEEDLVEYLLDYDRLHQKVFSSYIAFSTLCNFACVYCYEEGQTNRNLVMSNKILNDVIEWYKNILIQNNYKKCKVTLFGGEPLLHKDKIKFFIEELSKFTKNNLIELKIAIITNGYLLEQDIVNFLAANGLDEIQITIDGVEKIHDQRRPLKNGGGTFKTIMNNITTLNKFNGEILFRVSFDKNNIKNVKDLLKFFTLLKLNNNFKIYLAPIHQTTNQFQNKCSYCSVNTADNLEEILESYIYLYKYMNKLKLPIPKYYTNGPCMTVSNDTVLIDPQGKLFKCVEMIGINHLSVGEINSKKIDQNLSLFVGHPLFKKCLNTKCKYIALCGGGCLMKSYLKDKTLKNIDCEYKIFEKLIPLLLELNYANK